jgi:FtsP/CotA-like multicopper oxidase with cupredoxin domain
MAHPIHFHGQRFAVISRNGVANDNLVWKDTALLPAGETMDILLELTNPGEWMAHCHIAEHLGTGMMLSFIVDK